MKNSKFEFRAWDKTRGEMFCDKNMSGIKEFHFTQDMSIDIVKLFEYLPSESFTFKDLNINDVEILQFTGLLDKNGVKIFEGDILKQCNGSINGTQWMDKNYEVEHSPKGFNLPFFMWCDDGENNMDSTHWCEVIGNKFENPELLNVEIG